MNGNKFPQTDSIQELADFWDTHDLTNFDAELEDVDEAVFDRQATVTVRLEPVESRIVRSLARLQGIGRGTPGERRGNGRGSYSVHAGIACWGSAARTGFQSSPTGEDGPGFQSAGS